MLRHPMQEALEHREAHKSFEPVLWGIAGICAWSIGLNPAFIWSYRLGLHVVRKVLGDD